MGSIEELRKPDGSFMGMGVRVWLPQEKKWVDHWTGTHDGVVNPAQKGEFIDGEGIFITHEEVDGVKMAISRCVGPDHPDIVPLAPAGIERRRQDLGMELADGLDADGLVGRIMFRQKPLHRR